jgi:SWI/SNF-related matrix-associated actin-dependent regulator 1 of chromatin subfamily A
MMAVANKFDKECNVCGLLVRSGDGVATKYDGEWYTYHSGCTPDSVKLVENKERKSLVVTESKGQIFMPYNPAHVQLVKTIPNRTWNKDENCWEFPLTTDASKRAGEVAKILGLSIPDDFKVDTSSLQKCKSYNDMFDYQKEGSDFLSARSSALLGDEMGTGKTVQALCALPANQRVLIVCPSCVKFNWVKESNKWRPDYRVTVLSASKTKTDYEAEIIIGKNNFRLPEENEIFIINRELLPDFLVPVKQANSEFPTCELTPEFAKSLRETYLIVDEAHQFKGTKTSAHKKLRTLSKNSRSTWALTGTPLLNRPEDLWGVLASCNMEKIVFNKYGTKPYDYFYESFGGQQGRFGTVFHGPSKEMPSLMARVRLARKRKDVLPQLPDKIYTNIQISLDTTDGAIIRKKLDNLQKEFGKMIGDGGLPRFEKFSEIRADIARSRVPAMMEYVEECEEQDVPLVIFSAHKDPINVFYTREGWGVITGDTSAEDRQRTVDAFQAGKLKGVACTIKAAGIGITLTHAWKCLFVDLDWVPANNQQAEDRVCRIGQNSNKVEIIRFVANHPLDRRLFELLTEKEKLIKQTLDGGPKPASVDAIVGKRSYPEIVCDYEAARACSVVKLYDSQDLYNKLSNIVNMSESDWRFALVSQTDVRALKKLNQEFKDHALYAQAVSFILHRYDIVFEGMSDDRN